MVSFLKLKNYVKKSFLLFDEFNYVMAVCTKNINSKGKLKAKCSAMSKMYVFLNQCRILWCRSTGFSNYLASTNLIRNKFNQIKHAIKLLKQNVNIEYLDFKELYMIIMLKKVLHLGMLTRKTLSIPYFYKQIGHDVERNKEE